MLKPFARAFAVTSILIVPVQTFSASAAGARIGTARAALKRAEPRGLSGECDSYHLFWNHMSNALDWWRL